VSVYFSMWVRDQVGAGAGSHRGARSTRSSVGSTAGRENAGVWKADETYSGGALATHQGGLWVAKAETTEVPGTAESGWQLIVKRGQA
jgi:hypothetical protein